MVATWPAPSGSAARPGSTCRASRRGASPTARGRRRLWALTRDDNCKRAKTGYPEVAKTDAARAAFLKRLAYENCLEGFVLRPGDAANFSIGQGDVLVTPLQLARGLRGAGRPTARCAARGSAWALVRPDGTLVKQIEPSRWWASCRSREKERLYIKGALSRGGLRRHRGRGLQRVPDGQGAHRRQDRYRRGLGQDGHLLVRLLRADRRTRGSSWSSWSRRAGWAAQTAAPAVREIYEGIFGSQAARRRCPAASPCRSCRCSLPTER